MTARAAFATGLLLAVCAVPGVRAQEPATAEPAAAQTREEKFEASLGYQTGTVKLPGGMATLTLPDSFRYIPSAGAKRVLTDVWGNPPGAADGVLGMLVPSDLSPLTDEGWGIIITFDDDGYVNDDEAASMDFDDLLKDMKEGAADNNAERKKLGFEPVTLVGWAEPPHYDGQAHKLYWAKELQFGDNDEHTLNYNIRILGRRGVLLLNAVSSMNQLDDIRAETESVLAAVEFNEGHRYTDYLPGTDKAAAYGIAGLIAGGAAAKAGFFKVLWVGLLASKKLVVAGIVALVAFARKLFAAKSAEQTT
jgi:uncharacterized membrane-anchored protein